MADGSTTRRRAWLPRNVYQAIRDARTYPDGFLIGLAHVARHEPMRSQIEALRTSRCTAADYDEEDRLHANRRVLDRRDAGIERAFYEAGFGGSREDLRAAWGRFLPMVLRVAGRLVESAERRGRWQGRAEERARCIVDNRHGRAAHAPAGSWASCRD